MNYSLPDFARFCKDLHDEAGNPLVIRPFQKKALKGYFSGVRETVIVLPTGNGKTTLLGALAVYHMLRVPNASVVIVASAADQAATLFEQAATVIADTPYEDKLSVKHGIYKIVHAGPPSDRPPGKIRVISADVGRNEGAIPTLVLVDELHAHRDLRMYEMLRDKLWKRGKERGAGRMVTISTAGHDYASPLWTYRERAHALPTFNRTGTYNHAAERGLNWHEWCLADGDDLEDMKLVWKANPAPWITKAVLKERHDAPSMTPGQWSRYTCNLWTSGTESPIEAAVWDRGRVDIGTVEDGESVFLAPSVGHNAAIAIVARRPDGRLAVRVEHLDAEDGLSILARTEDAILALCERYDVVSAVIPRGGFVRSGDLLRDSNVPVTEFPHQPIRLVEASGTLNRLLKSGKLLHDGETQTREQMLAAMVKTNESGERYMPSDRARAVIAVAVACHAATAYEPEPYIGAPSVVG